MYECVCICMLYVCIVRLVCVYVCAFAFSICKHLCYVVHLVYLTQITFWG